MERNDKKEGGIVVGVDATPEAAAALDWAITEAVAQHTTLTLVHAIGEEIGAWIELEPHRIRAVIETAAASAEQLLADARAHVYSLAPHLGVNRQIRLEPPAAAVMELGRTAELLVVGNHDSRAPRTACLDVLKPFLAAGVTCPVAVAPRRHARGVGVLVLADGTPARTPNLVFAFEEALRQGLNLTVVHCTPDPLEGAAAWDSWWDEAITSPWACPDHDTLVGFQRTLLAIQVEDLARRFGDVNTQVVTDAGAGDELLVAAVRAMDMVIADAGYGQRIRALSASATSEALQAVTVILPRPRPVADDVSSERLGDLLADLERELWPPAEGSSPAVAETGSFPRIESHDPPFEDLCPVRVRRNRRAGYPRRQTRDTGVD